MLYDGDAAGQKATKRAIPILEKAGISVKVLQIPDNMDPDDYLRKYGADRFKMLLEGSTNRVEYQLSAIRANYDLNIDEQRIKFMTDCAELISTLDSAAQREVYGNRIAEAAKVSYDTMKLEINKAFKRRTARQKKQQEAIDLAPAKALQPQIRGLRYDNMKSAIAEEGILSQVMKDSSLLEYAKELKPQDFSVELFGRVYAQLCQRHSMGMEVSLGVLELDSQEMNHLTSVCQRHQGPVNEQAFKDCVATVLNQRRSKEVVTDEDLLAFRNKLKERKGTGL